MEKEISGLDWKHREKSSRSTLRRGALSLWSQPLKRDWLLELVGGALGTDGLPD